MKSVIALLNKLNYPKRQIHHLRDLQDGILFAQLEDEFFQTDMKKLLWNQIINRLQKTRRNNNLQIKEFSEDIAFCDNNEELTKFIQYFLETLIQVKKEEFISYMTSCPEYQQLEIANFIQCDLQEINGLSDYSQLEYQSTSVIISLEENLYSKDHLIQQQNKQIEQMKSDYQNIFIEMQSKIMEYKEIIDQLTYQINFFLDKVICNDFEEAWLKFEEFIKDQEKNKEQIEYLNNLVETQQKEVSKKKRKNQKQKSQLSSNQPTERALDYEIPDSKDNSEIRTVELLKKEIQVLKEENKKLVGRKSQYEQDIGKLKKKLYEYEQESTQYKKKMEKYKLELEEYLNSNQQDKRSQIENLRTQGLLSSNNSQILDIEQKFWVSPKSNCFDFNQSLIKLDHQPSIINQSFKNSDEITIAKLQQQIAEKNTRISNLERQVNSIQHGFHSRGNSLTKVNQYPQDRHIDNFTMQENYRFFAQYSKEKDKELKEIKKQQNENFLLICKQLIKQNEQMEKMNSLIFQLQNEEQIKEDDKSQSEDVQSLHQYYLQALSDKDELLQLITSIFYENVKI
ncbi:unnamed protein product (macronuclear) [Paramecium tetraurelia]|uniref:Calponin-homology (CH) domain-containing protein n=1 Tax=Paramecium tetraurelia TaxID=5888 RepID=A0BUK0_PARTE|nr:uncharacterized protein GSPATT00005463001 [Paramecium tetraurelia]CAK62217.1 unnamed protein product [Paramecium tetraurelia]|eukprot:XP_001429615.1 hypothetical protein (macronuclear) [Paramecium tetraurelia strain d4-2]